MNLKSLICKERFTKASIEHDFTAVTKNNETANLNEILSTNTSRF